MAARLLFRIIKYIGSFFGFRMHSYLCFFPVYVNAQVNVFQLICSIIVSARICKFEDLCIYATGFPSHA
jgi:hypothetical protein